MVTLKVCMFVYNNFKHDTRVLKEAKSLTLAGYQVTVVALLDDDSKPYEEIEGIRIIRVVKNPLDFRILKWVSEFTPLGAARNCWLWGKTVARQPVSVTLNGLCEKLKQLRAWFKAPETEVVEKPSLWDSVKQTFQQAWQDIRQRGKKAYLKEAWQKNPLFFLGLQGLFFFTYCLHLVVRPVYYWGIKRPAKIFWARYLKRWWYWGIKRPAKIFWKRYLKRWWCWGIQRPAKIFWKRYLKRWWYWGIQRPAKIFWKRYLKRWWYWGIQRPAKIFWKRYLKRWWYWGIQRPAKIFWKCYLKRWWYWGIQRPAKIFWHRHFYRTLKKLLVSVHRPLCFLDYHYRSLQVVTQEPADIYHAHDLNVLAVAYHAAQRHGAKLVYDSHEFYVERNRQYSLTRVGKFLLSRFEEFLIRRSDAVITVSDTIAKQLAQRYRVPVPTVILNAPALVRRSSQNSEQSIRLALDIPADYHLLLYSGGITFNRGLEKIIESLHYLTDCHFVMMGYGSQKYVEQLQNLAVNVGVASRVSLFGPVPSEAVTTYAASADLGIAAIENVCLSYYYCAPNKLFEYISAGLPVIASNFPEMQKIITQYALGCTFDPSQPKDIARAAREVLSNRERLHQMRENTWAASQMYNWENESKKLLALYQTLS